MCQSIFKAVGKPFRILNTFKQHLILLHLKLQDKHLKCFKMPRCPNISFGLPFVLELKPKVYTICFYLGIFLYSVFFKKTLVNFYGNISSVFEWMPKFVIWVAFCLGNVWKTYMKYFSNNVARLLGLLGHLNLSWMVPGKGKTLKAIQLLSKTSKIRNLDNQNVHRTNVDKRKRRQTKTSTNRNVDKPKRRHTERQQTKTPQETVVHQMIN